MRPAVLVAIVLLVGAQTCSALPYGDDNNDLYSNPDYAEDSEEDAEQPKENPIADLPTFTAREQNVLVNEGSTIRLPCMVDRLEGFVLLWIKNLPANSKRGGDVVAVGDRITERDTRFTLEKFEHGNNLLINLAEEGDAGNYTCQGSIHIMPKLGLLSRRLSELDLEEEEEEEEKKAGECGSSAHTICIPLRPEVEPVPANGVIVAKVGSKVDLNCVVTKGDPAPAVTWHRRERKMPDGAVSNQGNSLTFHSVTRHHTGNYICSADNGFGEPSEALIKLDVQHAPEIEQEETFIHTGEGDETEIICIIHSSPRADVTWLKDGHELSSPVEGIVNVRGNRHTLLIPNVKESSFGDYTCRARNKYGEDEKTFRVSGKAGDVVFHSDPKGPNYDRYQLHWTGSSSTPITHFRVQWRAERGDAQWSDAEVTSLALPSDPNNHSRQDQFSGKHTIAGLRPKTVYLARVASKNSYGFNDYGKIFKFATKGADPIQKPITGSGTSLRGELFFALLSSAVLLLALK